MSADPFNPRTAAHLDVPEQAESEALRAYFAGSGYSERERIRMAIAAATPHLAAEPVPSPERSEAGDLFAAIIRQVQDARRENVERPVLPIAAIQRLERIEQIARQGHELPASASVSDGGDSLRGAKARLREAYGDFVAAGGDPYREVAAEAWELWASGDEERTMLCDEMRQRGLDVVPWGSSAGDDEREAGDFGLRAAFDRWAVLANDESLSLHDRGSCRDAAKAIASVIADRDYHDRWLERKAERAAPAPSDVQACGWCEGRGFVAAPDGRSVCPECEGELPVPSDVQEDE